MEKATYKQELSKQITALIGYHLGEDHIHNIHADGSGWHYYIQSLKPGYPVLAMHYRGPLMLALPYDDYCKLEAGEITAEQYIQESHWNYGYYWGGGGLLSGAYWQPLEKETGIHDTERISRYLHILSCRTDLISSGYRPTEEQCQKCKLDATNCPFSPLNETGAWEKEEVQERDDRQKLFKAVIQRVEAELGFKTGHVMSHGRGSCSNCNCSFKTSDAMSCGCGGDEILLFPGYEPNTVQVYLHKDTLNDLLYHPGALDSKELKMLAESMKIILGIPWQPDWATPLPDEVTDKRAFCLNFWGDRMSQESESAPEGGALPMTTDGTNAPQKPSFFGKILATVRDKFQI